MRLLDCSYDSPARNLALDEALLNAVESGASDEALRFWESPTPFVVLGVSQVLRDHVNVKQCEEDGVPVLRRCSAGGCVLQGPGCLNYSLVLRYAEHANTQTVRGSYCYILGALGRAFKQRGLNIEHSGISDLALDEMKVSGNAQKRKKHSFLHHGTLLYSCDTEKLAAYLLEPADRPEYRGDRPHAQFVRSIPLAAHDIRSAVCAAFDITAPESAPTALELEDTATLEHTKYTNSTWTNRR